MKGWVPEWGVCVCKIKDFSVWVGMQCASKFSTATLCSCLFFLIMNEVTNNIQDAMIFVNDCNLNEIKSVRSE